VTKLHEIVAIICFGGITLSASAQCGNGIPSAGNPGCIPPDRSNSPYYNGGGGNAPPPPRAVWANRWGAIAMDKKTGNYGVSANQEKHGEANQVAMSDCASDGSSNCEIILSYHDECAAFAGGPGRMGAAGRAEISEAKAIALSSCSKNGAACTILYSACSLPVRTQ
jgi:hypothetical protein